jgi:hypothetical protein
MARSFRLPHDAIALGTGRLVHVLKFMFHQSRKVFRPEEVVNPLGELRKTGIVFSTEAHTVIMDAIVSPKSSFAKGNRSD